jgi:hypothetical protein
MDLFYRTILAKIAEAGGQQMLRIFCKAEDVSVSDSNEFILKLTVQKLNQRSELCVHFELHEGIRCVDFQSIAELSLFITRVSAFVLQHFFWLEGLLL